MSNNEAIKMAIKAVINNENQILITAEIDGKELQFNLEDLKEVLLKEIKR